MKKKFRSEMRLIFALGILTLILSVGIFHAFIKGANDFNVFYQAWQLVLLGRGGEIYRVSPDRFLYSPGFAWIFAPLGILQKPISLAVWCCLKLIALGYAINLVSKECLRNQHVVKLTPVDGWFLSICGVLLVARPLLIDFEYGQVNTMILAACLWSLSNHFYSRSNGIQIAGSWFVMSLLAFAKLFPAPILLIPWVLPYGNPLKKLVLERRAIFLAAIMTVFLPVWSLGWGGSLFLLSEWRDALMSRGVPLDSHNQSFIALLYHYLSGNSTPVIAEGRQLLLLGFSWLTLGQISLLSLSWTFTSVGFLVGWIIRGPKDEVLKWMVVLIGMLIVPSHLVWKPYFVMSLPLAIYALNKVKEKKGNIYLFGVMVLLFGINFTGFDFIGHAWAAYFEAGSILLFMHFLLTGIVLLA